MEYGICRVSTKKQDISRQERNILSVYPKAFIIKETYTGTKLEGRTEFEKVLKKVVKGDTLIFDSVSRMSRNSKEGTELYEKLFNKGINIVFLKESYINTDVYKQTIDSRIKIEVNTGNKSTDNLINSMIKLLSNYAIDIAKEQIKRAFEEAQKEVDDLHQKTREGMLTAKLKGKQIGRKKGATVETKKAKETKELILKHSKTFDGTLTDKELIKLAGVHKETYYIYKKQLKEEMSKLII